MYTPIRIASMAVSSDLKHEVMFCHFISHNSAWIQCNALNKQAFRGSCGLTHVSQKNGENNMMLSWFESIMPEAINGMHASWH
jgi:hypothetical protein